VRLHQLLALELAATALPLFAPRHFNENAPHCLTCGCEEMVSAVPLLLRRASQPQPGFMNEGGGLQSLARGFVRHSMRGKLAQFVVNERKQFLSGLGLALLQAVEDARDLAHERRIEEKFGMSIPEGTWGANAWPATIKSDR
jgi:hypothetical protein